MTKLISFGIIPGSINLHNISGEAAKDSGWCGDMFDTTGVQPEDEPANTTRECTGMINQTFTKEKFNSLC